MKQKDLLQIIDKLRALVKRQNIERQEEIDKLKIKAEKTKSDKIREKRLDEIKALELLKGKVVFKNHEDMCDKLGFAYKNNTNSKLSNLKTLQQIAEYHKEGQRIIVDEIYNEVKKRETNYVAGTGRREVYKQFLGGGIYKIQLDNKVYIGQTIKFNQRYENHRNNYKNNPKTNELLKQGATFEPLEIIENTQDKNFMYTREQYWYEYYKNLGYDMVNTQTPMKSKSEELRRYKGKKVKRRKPYIYKHFKIKKEDYPKLLELLKDSNIQLY